MWVPQKGAAQVEHLLDKGPCYWTSRKLEALVAAKKTAATAKPVAKKTTTAKKAAPVAKKAVSAKAVPAKKVATPIKKSAVKTAAKKETAKTDIRGQKLSLS